MQRTDRPRPAIPDAHSPDFPVTASFQSRHHPGSAPRGLVYARRLAGPLGACTLPLMIGATVAALLGEAVWPFLVWGLPAALLVATGWARFALSTTTASVHLREGKCAIESVHDVLRNRSRTWEPLYGIRESSGDIELYLEWTTYVLRPADWPEFASLRTAARQASGTAPERPTPSPPGT